MRERWSKYVLVNKTFERYLLSQPAANQA